MDPSFWFNVWFFAPMVLGVLCIAGGFYFVRTTARAVLPSMFILAGIALLCFVPQIVVKTMPSSVSWYATAISYQNVVACLLLTATVILLVADIVFSLCGMPLAQHNLVTIPAPAAGAPAGTPAPPTAALLRQMQVTEVVMDLLSLLLVFIAIGTWQWYLNKPSDALMEVARIARSHQDMKVQLFPFIVSAPGDAFQDAENIKKEVIRVAKEHGSKGLEVEKIREVRFIAADNNHINEIFVVFDGRRLMKAAVPEVKDATSGEITSPEVPAVWQSLKNVGISVFVKPNQAFTEKVATDLKIRFGSRDPNGRGIGFIPASDPNVMDSLDYKIDATRSPE